MRLIYLLLPLLLLTACRDDFSLEAPPADIPVVYAYLDAQAEENYVRLERVFAEPGGDATQLAQDPDRLYYGPEEATVTLSAGNQVVELERINGEDFGFERREGVFATTPNILYRLSDEQLNLQGGQQVTLRVSRNNNNEATATTTILPELNIRNPTFDNGINPGEYNRVTTFRFSADESAKVFDLRLYFNIREQTISNPDEISSRRLEMVLANAFQRGGNDDAILLFRLDNEAIWQFLANELEPDNDIRRFLVNMDFQLTAVGEEVEELLELATANAGITSSQAIPTYSNVDGGLGVVTSRSVTLLESFPLNPQSRDTLRNGIYTRDLGFQ